MAHGIIIGAAVIGAGYLALRKSQVAKETAATAESAGPKVGQNEINSIGTAEAAADTPGTFVQADGTPVFSDGTTGYVSDPVRNGSTSCTPCGDNIAGSSSNTPSGGGSYTPVLGTQDIYENGSPVGPNVMTARPPDSTLVTRIKFGSLRGLTSRQEAAALHEEGPALKLVW